ncbi:MAG: class I SAM-dependent methyltransferase [Chloroflexota bacterium]
MSEHENKKFTNVERLRSPERLGRLELERVIELCLAGEGDKLQKVLDVGTGSAVFAEAFANKGLEVTGVDENPEMLEAALRFVPQADLRQASAEALPFSEGEFDLVFLGMVLHEVDDPVKTLEEARRVAKTRVAVLEWPYREEEMGPPLAHRLKPETVAELARQAGLSRLETLPLSHLVLYRMEQ